MVAGVSGWGANRRDIVALATNGRTVNLATWDNAKPADSRARRAGLGGLGLTPSLNTKTSIVVVLRPRNDWRHVRAAIVGNLDPVRGRAVYVNLGPAKAWE